jgi:hypothetical protein
LLAKRPILERIAAEMTRAVFAGNKSTLIFSSTYSVSSDAIHAGGQISKS